MIYQVLIGGIKGRQLHLPLNKVGKRIIERFGREEIGQTNRSRSEEGDRAFSGGFDHVFCKERGEYYGKD